MAGTVLQIEIEFEMKLIFPIQFQLKFKFHPHIMLINVLQSFQHLYQQLSSSNTLQTPQLPRIYDAFIVTVELYFVLVLELYCFIFLVIALNFNLRPKLDMLCFSWFV